MKGNIFLSAGIPDQPERGPYMETSDPIAIRDAVRALTGVVLARGYGLVFGGHPAISPLVCQIAHEMEMIRNVIIYQSEHYRNLAPLEVHQFHQQIWTPAGKDSGDSIFILRKKMLTSHPLVAGFFIGGMNGIEDEYRLSGEFQPSVPRFPVGSSGGAARTLLQFTDDFKPPLRKRLESDYRYRSLFRDLIGEYQGQMSIPV